jgi:hypothetical protein
MFLLSTQPDEPKPDQRPPETVQSAKPVETSYSYLPDLCKTLQHSATMIYENGHLYAWCMECGVKVEVY